MSEKKGLCPMRILWNGDGIAKKIMIAGLLSMSLGVVFKIIMGASFTPVFGRIFMGGGGLCWLLGKILTKRISMVPRRGLEPPRS